MKGIYILNFYHFYSFFLHVCFFSPFLGFIHISLSFLFCDRGFMVVVLETDFINFFLCFCLLQGC